MTKHFALLINVINNNTSLDKAHYMDWIYTLTKSHCKVSKYYKGQSTALSRHCNRDLLREQNIKQTC